MDLASHHLVEECFAWTVRRAALQPVPLSALPEMKFLHRGGFQKAIRRGQADRATTLALHLYRLDVSYAWRSVLTVAVEDIGAADPDAVLWSTMAQSVLFRRAVGEVPLLIALTLSMANTPKSRISCDLPYVVDRDQPKLFTAFGQLSASDLLKKVESRDPTERYVALAVLRGIVPAGLKMKECDRRALEECFQLISDRLPQAYARAAIAALKKPQDEMGVALTSAFDIFCTDQSDVEHDDLAGSWGIGSHASEAFDQHERTGRRAICRFADDLAARGMSVCNLPASVHRKIVMDAVFVEEGQCANARWAGSTSEGLRATFNTFMLTRHGISPAGAEQVRDVVRKNIGLLNAHRCAEARRNGLL